MNFKSRFDSKYILFLFCILCALISTGRKPTAADAPKFEIFGGEKDVYGDISNFTVRDIRNNNYSLGYRHYEPSVIMVVPYAGSQNEEYPETDAKPLSHCMIKIKDRVDIVLESDDSPLEFITVKGRDNTLVFDGERTAEGDTLIIGKLTAVEEGKNELKLIMHKYGIYDKKFSDSQPLTAGQLADFLLKIASPPQLEGQKIVRRRL